MSKFFLLLISVLLLFSPSHAQQISEDYFQTPNASDLGRYGDTKVSFYTGQANIEIPLYSFDIGGCDFPIALVYDTSGVLVNKFPGWTGSNWTLQAGGAIVRTKQGHWDEAELVNKTTLTSFSNYFSSPSQLLSDMQDDNVLKENLYLNRCDYSPDVFTFNFLGKTGKFFLGNDGQWKVYSDDNIDVVFDTSDKDNYIAPFTDRYPVSIMKKTQKTIKGFTLRDDKGYIYEFGGTSDAIDYTLPFFRQMESERTECFFPVCWYLTSVKDKYGNELYRLDYERGKFMAQFYRDSEYMYVEQYDKTDGIKFGNSFFRSNDSFPYGGTLSSPVYLTKISLGNSGTPLAEFTSEYSDVPTEKYYPSLDVNNAYIGAEYDGHAFFYLQTDDDDVRKYQYVQPGASRNANPLCSTRAKLLRGIRFQNWNVDFAYGDESRRFLRKVVFDKDKDAEETYEMRYYFPENVPSDLLGTNVDDWGYYRSVVPAASVSNPFGIDRSGTLYGSLTEIVYPTGGSVRLGYDINDYGSCMSDDRTKMENTRGKTGGLRIRRITEYDSDGSTILRDRTYSYSAPATDLSSGELFAKPRHQWENWYANTDSRSSYSKQSYYRNVSIIPLSNSFGPHVGYSCVKETEQDGSYRIYRFQNISSSHDEPFVKDFSGGQPSPFDMYTERGYKRGKPLSIETFSAQGQMMSRMAFGYTAGDTENDCVLTSNLRRANFGDSAVFGYYTGGIYKLLFPKYDIAADTLYTFSANGMMKDINIYDRSSNTIDTDFRYGHNIQIRTLDRVTHKRGQHEESTSYGYAYSSPAQATQDVAYKQFDLRPCRIEKHVNGHLCSGTLNEYETTDIGPVLKSQSRINSDGSQTKIVEYDAFTKNGLPGIARRNGYADSELTWDASCRLASVYSGGKETTDMKYLHTGAFYDISGNIAELTSPNGYVRNYDYDIHGRLTREYENYEHMLRIHTYNFKK